EIEANATQAVGTSRHSSAHSAWNLRHFLKRRFHVCPGGKGCGQTPEKLHTDEAEKESFHGVFSRNRTATNSDNCTLAFSSSPALRLAQRNCRSGSWPS